MSDSRHPADRLPEEEKAIFDLLDQAQEITFRLNTLQSRPEKERRRLKNTETLLFAVMDTLCPECRCGCSSCERFHDDLEEVLFRKYWTI